MSYSQIHQLCVILLVLQKNISQIGLKSYSKRKPKSIYFYDLERFYNN